VRRPTGERSAAKLAELTRLHGEGRLRIVVQAAFPLVEASAAHREVEAGHVRGKVVLVSS
jgi:enoyl reductase